jgi:gliding motility-associated-like protein
VVENFKPFAGGDTIIVKGQKIRFDGQGGVNYNWTPSLYLDDTLVYDPTGYFTDTGTFKYAMSVTSSYGCKGIDTFVVQVVNNASFYVPTAFTPNNDGRNDYFKPLAVGFTQLNYFRIYNRWGQLVYTTRNFETGWDGTCNGKQAELGVYYWEISFVDLTGKQGVAKGDVTLIR